jgi:hypothetical protein
MVAPNFSNDRPYARKPTNAQPTRTRNPLYWSIYSNGANDDEPPSVPPKDRDYSTAFTSPESSSPSLATYTRPRHTSFSAYEPQSATRPIPEPQRPRLKSQRSGFSLASFVRHRASKSDTGVGASTTSLWRPESNRESYPVTVFTPFNSLQHHRDSFLSARTTSFRRSP